MLGEYPISCFLNIQLQSPIIIKADRRYMMARIGSNIIHMFPLNKGHKHD